MHAKGLILTCFVYGNIVASGAITSWQIDGEIMEIVTDVTEFVFLDSRITVDDDFTHGIETHLFLVVGQEEL